MVFFFDHHQHVILCYRESIDSTQKQIETLRADLQAERSNFSSVSKVLNQQRRLSSTTKNQQNQVIKVRIDEETNVKCFR